MNYSIVGVEKSLIATSDIKAKLANSGIVKVTAEKYIYFASSSLSHSALVCELLTRFFLELDQVRRVTDSTFAKIVKVIETTRVTRSESITLSNTDQAKLKAPEPVKSESKPGDTDQKPQTSVFSEQPKSAATDSETKFSAGRTMTEDKPSFRVDFQCPVLKPSNNESVNKYIFSMRYADSLSACPTRNLIYMSLIKSNLEELLQTLSNEQLSEIEPFCDFIKQAYSDSSGNQQWRDLANVAQRDNESELLYLQRLLKAFYDVKGSQVPKVVPEADQDEIRHRFTAGLKVSEVKRLMTQQKAIINFDNLAKMAKHFRESIAIDSASKGLSVLSIDRRDSSRGVGRRERRRFDSESDSDSDRNYRDDRYHDRYRESRSRYPSNDRFYNSNSYRGERSQSFSRGRSDSRGRPGAREERDDRFRSTSRGRSQERTGSFDRLERSNSRGQRRVTFDDRRACFKCGTIGHLVKDCVASDRIVKRYQRSRERSRENRDYR